MPILDAEILWRPAALLSNATPAQNGGRMASTQLVSGDLARITVGARVRRVPER